MTLSGEAKEFIKKLLQYDPEKRISAAEALNDPWMKKFQTGGEVQKGFILQSIENLRAFRTQMTFQKAVLAYMASQQLSKAEEQKLQEAFDQLDANKNGVISSEEVERGLGIAYGQAVNEKKEASRIMRRIDLNKNGYIDYNGIPNNLEILEFLMANLEIEKVMSEERLREAFNFFDIVMLLFTRTQDHDGSITIEELRKNFLSICNETTINKILEEVDADKNGAISFEEFCKMMDQYQTFNASCKRGKVPLKKVTAGHISGRVLLP